MSTCLVSRYLELSELIANTKSVKLINEYSEECDTIWSQMSDEQHDEVLNQI